MSARFFCGIRATDFLYKEKLGLRSFKYGIFSSKSFGPGVVNFSTYSHTEMFVCLCFAFEINLFFFIYDSKAAIKRRRSVFLQLPTWIHTYIDTTILTMMNKQVIFLCMYNPWIYIYLNTCACIHVYWSTYVQTHFFRRLPLNRKQKDRLSSLRK